MTSSESSRKHVRFYGNRITKKTQQQDSTKSGRVASGTTRKPFRRTGTKPQRQRWSSMPTDTPQRRGSGVKYGDVDLTPKDKYTVTSGHSRQGKLRIAVMGGNEEIGRNMTLLEYGNDIVLIDMGVQFAEEGMLGVDGMVPNLSYLKGKEDRVKAVIITHSHTDHIGGISHLMPMLPNVPLFSAPVTLAMIAKKLEYTPDVKFDMRAIDNDSRIELGAFTVRFFGVSHSVLSSHGVILETPVGTIVHTGDFKVDLNPHTAEERANLQSFKDLGSEQVLALLSDSTNANQTGNQLMEKDVEHDLENIFKDTKGRLVFGMISSNMVRLGQLIKLAEQYGRYVAIEGLSIKTNLEIAEQLGYIKYNPETIVDVKKINSYAKHQVMIVCAGAQGESNAAFSRVAEGKHKDIEVISGDTVIFSSSIIPGNERTVQRVTDMFYRQGAKVINYRMLDIHAGGHARQDDLKEVVSFVKPKYLIPIEGMHAFLHMHAEAGIAAGMKPENVFIADNGQVIEFDKNKNGRLTNERLNTEYVFIDGKTLGEVDNEVLKERMHIGEDGVIIVTFGWKDGVLYGGIHVNALGFKKQALLKKFIQYVVSFVDEKIKRIPKSQRHSIPRWRQYIAEQLLKDIQETLGRNPYVIMNVIPVSGKKESGKR